MNPAPNRYRAGCDSSVKKRPYTDMATTATEPPSHMGVPAQYSREVRAPAKRPKAIRTQT
jgi:hypothetical protein